MKRNIAYYLLIKDGEPSTLHEVKARMYPCKWQQCKRRLALHKNKTWDTISLPQGKKAIYNKWVYKIKHDGNDQVEHYHARLVVKRYTQKRKYRLQ